MHAQIVVATGVDLTCHALEVHAESRAGLVREAVAALANLSHER